MAERYEREIEEILRNAGDIGNRPTPIRPRPARPSSSRFGGFFARLMPSGQLMLASLVLALVAYLFQAQRSPMATVFVFAALGCFVAGYVWAFRGPRNLGSDRRWRGQPVDYDRPIGPDLGVRFRRWWERVSRR